MKKAVAIMILASSLLGCSNDAPSNSEIKAAVKDYTAMAIPKQCTRILVENIVKKNGQKVDEGTYRIQAGYEVRIVPVDQDDPQIDALQAQQESAEAQVESSFKEVTRITSEESGGYPMAPSDFIESPGKMTDQIRPLVQQYADAKKRAFDLSMEIMNHESALSDAWGPTECRLLAHNQSVGAFSGDDLSNAIRRGASSNVDLELTMVKTDNGWMLAR